MFENADGNDIIGGDQNAIRPSMLSSISQMELPVISFREVLSVNRSLMALIAQFITYFAMSFNTPLLSGHCDELGYSPIFMGVSMITAAITYVLSMPFVSILSKKMSKKGVLFFGLAT